MTKSLFLITLLVFLVGVFFRLYKLTDFPPGLIQDEVVAAYDAFALLETGRDHHGVLWPLTFSSFNDWVSPFFIYYLTPFIKVFGLNAFAVRFSVSLLSIISLVLFYFVAKEFFKEKSKAFFAFALFSFSSFAIMTARWAIPTHTIILPFLVFLFFLGKAMNTAQHQMTNLLWAQIFLGISIYTDTAMKVFGPLIHLTSLFTIKHLVNKKWLFFLFLTFSIVSAPTLFDHLFNLQERNNRFNMISVFSLSDFWMFTFLQNYFSYLSPVTLFVSGDVNPVRTIPNLGYEHLFYSLFFYSGLFLLIYKLIKKKINLHEKFLLLYFLVSPLPTSLTLPAADFQRALYILPVLILISSEGLFFLWQRLSMFLTKKFFVPLRLAQIEIIIFLSIILLLNFSFFTMNYFSQKYQNINKYYFQYGLDKVFYYLLKNEQQYEQIYISNVINMPYIYYLYYSQYDPRKLRYADYEKNDDQGWTNVEKIGKYHFVSIDNSSFVNAKLIYEAQNSPLAKYQIWEKDKIIYVTLYSSPEAQP